MALFGIGDLITFTYPAVHQLGTRAHDRYPKVLVLHNNWQGLVHGLNFNYLTEDEINTVRMILDPFFEMKEAPFLKEKNPQAYAELESLLHGKVGEAIGPHSRMARITSPRAFYLNVVKPFISPRGWDPYRLYKPQLMTGVRILQRENHMSGKDSYAKFQAQQRDKMAQIRQAQGQQQRQMAQPQQGQVPGQPGQQPGQGQAPQDTRMSQSLINWFKNKFQAMRGPQMATRTPSFQQPLAPEPTTPTAKKHRPRTGQLRPSYRPRLPKK